MMSFHKHERLERVIECELNSRVFHSSLAYLSTLLEDIAVALIVVAWSPWLAVHIRHIMRRRLPFKRGQTRTVLPWLFATQFTGFGVTVSLSLAALTRL